nr:hypothetical protein [Allorhizobium sp. Av2]
MPLRGPSPACPSQWPYAWSSLFLPKHVVFVKPFHTFTRHSFLLAHVVFIKPLYTFMRHA